VKIIKKDRNDIKVAVIGAGEFANKLHYPCICKMKGVQVVAICDLNIKRLNTTADIYGIKKRYTNYKEMLDNNNIDVVYVIMPPNPLKKIVIDCLKRKKHVFMEKPPGSTLSETREMNQIAIENNCKTMIGFNRRWTPIIIESKKRIEERGYPNLVVGEYHKHMLKREPEHDNHSWLVVDIIHNLDTILFIGGELESFKVNINNMYGSKANNIYTVLFSFKSGCSGVLFSNFCSGNRLERFEIHGKGIAAFIEPPEKAEIFKDKIDVNETLYGEKLSNSNDFLFKFGYYQESRYFFDCINKDVNPITNLEHGVNLMEIIKKIDDETNQ
jgi:virulence factor